MIVVVIHADGINGDDGVFGVLGVIGPFETREDAFAWGGRVATGELGRDYDVFTLTAVADALTLIPDGDGDEDDEE